MVIQDFDKNKRFMGHLAHLGCSWYRYISTSSEKISRFYHYIRFKCKKTFFVQTWILLCACLIEIYESPEETWGCWKIDISNCAIRSHWLVIRSNGLIICSLEVDNSFSRNCKSFPRIRQSFFSNCNSFPRIWQSRFVV